MMDRPAGWPTVTPRIVAMGAREFVAFLVRVFGATGQFEESRPSVVWLGDSPVLVSEAGVRRPTSAFLYVYVADVDATFQHAVEEGARVIEAPLDTPYGDRRCMVEDPWGNAWASGQVRGVTRI